MTRMKCAEVYVEAPQSRFRYQTGLVVDEKGCNCNKGIRYGPDAPFHDKTACDRGLGPVGHRAVPASTGDERGDLHVVRRAYTVNWRYSKSLALLVVRTATM